MKYILNHEGKPYLKFFEDIAAIPHGSYNEKAISDYIVEFAKSRNLWYIQDEKYNVLIKKPATPGYEDHEPIILQGHMDMVCEKVPGSGHDFEKDPLQLYVEDGWLKARNTTLGADNGVAVAYILAILDEEELQHPDLECVLNVSEEPGVYGAIAFNTAQLKGKKFIGLDGCTEGTSTILTTGVIGGSFFKELQWEDSVKDTYEIKIWGLTAGHGGGNIGKEQANAIKAMFRILYYIHSEVGLNIAYVRGGTIRNAIAEECEAVISIDGKMKNRVFEIFDRCRKQEIEEHKISDPNIDMSFKKVSGYTRMLTDACTKDIIEFVYLTPSGALMRSLVYEGLPISSRNMGTIDIAPDGRVELSYLFRCVNFGQLVDLLEQGVLLAGIYGFTFDEQCRYSGYEVEPGRPLYNTYAEVYKEMSGQGLLYEIVHYGTDAGTYAERIPDLDIIVISPTIIDVHRPTERLDLASFHRAYQYLKGVLERS